jgi:hypothetical protein
MQVIYSNDGICWTSPQWATRTGGPMSQCLGIYNSVPVEQVTALDDGTAIELIGVEGSISYLIDPQHMYETALIGYSPVTDPSLVYFYGYPKVTTGGVASPSSLLLPNWWVYSYEDRFKPYNYFMNLQAAFDPSTGDLYIGRAYPYPFDRGPASDMDLNEAFVPTFLQAAATMMTDSVTGRYASRRVQSFTGYTSEQNPVVQNAYRVDVKFCSSGEFSQLLDVAGGPRQCVWLQ